MTSKNDKQGMRYAPFYFTVQGVTMLSCILNSSRKELLNPPQPPRPRIGFRRKDENA